MKMFKKLMAVVLTGALAVSMLTGCSLSEVAKAKALEKALNSGNAQGETKVVKYDHENGLDSKAEKVYEDVFKKDKTQIVASTDLKTITVGSNVYAYYVIKAPSDASDLKKSGEWSAKELHDALYDAVEAKDHPAATIFADGQKYNVKNNAKVTADKAEVDFGVKVYSNGKDGNAKGYFAIVTVKLVAVA